MSLELAGSILMDGVAYAMVLFMITIGLSMTMGLMRVVNLAHGAFAMAGGFLAAALPGALGLPVWLGMVLAIALVALAALPIERWLLRRFYRRSELDQMLVTIGIMFICMALANIVFGSSIKSVALPEALQGSIDIGYRLVQKHRLFVMLLGMAVLVLLWFAVERSDFGIRVRAAVDNAPTAQAVGIDTARLYAVAFAAGAALAALGGIVGAELLPMEASYAGKYLVTFLAVVAVGGQGTLAGSFVAALLLGGVETTMKYLVPQLSSVAFFLTMFLVLLLRPQGLFGRRA
ncbi:MAG: branched-chain amino acid ABC transporter permease [Hydrogenophaga sp.]|uniref:branched-chain amino acid ABC transporter permease n=1 Tax=Hydrogenophaga sp. TaxID=1904254 RepID=UPI0016B7EA46|nr:branched-chain amino acid ABC transporter permease [Hydrogenophaga sp.]NIM41905.1 branched-chain amino acid ABC transporter permease [Hydrogenophaga sp.]NIN27208.1 branched-chain amino acid ABC transporter permease [Hydrogenophaga sp.]NIN31909.1 branched-chain amino acid ABC transporter permease [Hydrogenophaga sp.]NIN56302.1 branched-chain amino acid ABC transporter permease [Hydrogenophaga sp.]NIO52282.1 branched-chain amino acid ABC transporter permease [Hydrogenophaga sp.]